LEKSKTSLFGSLFKREHRDEYPQTQPYTGPLSSTHYREIQQTPIKHVYHQGFYEKLEEKPTVTVISNEPYTGPLSSTHYREIQSTPISNLPSQSYYEKLEEKPIETTRTVIKVRKEPSPYDLSTEVYSGPLHSIRHSEIVSTPAENITHQGYYDQLEQKPGLFGSLFRKSHEDFPKSEPYSGPLSATHYQEIQQTPISNLPSQAYYDKLEHKKEYLKSEPYSGPLSSTHYQEIQPTPIQHLPSQSYCDKLEEKPIETTHTVLRVRKEPSPYDLSTEVYSGPLSSTFHNELPSEPIEGHVNVRHSGFSDEIVEEEPKEKSGLFGFLKRERKEDFPISGPYTGDLSSVHYREIQSSPISNVYNQGFYDKLEEKPVETTHTVIKVLKEPSQYDFSKEPYTGPLSSTFHNELPSEPIEGHVNVRHSGFSDEVVEEEPKEKSGLFGFLKRERKEDFPTSEPFEGEYQQIYRHYEFPYHEISQHSAPYNAGFYNKLEQRPIIVEERVEMTPTPKGTNLKYI
jgi:hypothetical protein